VHISSCNPPDNSLNTSQASPDSGTTLGTGSPFSLFPIFRPASLQPLFTKTEVRYEMDSTGKEVARAYQRTLSERARETITQVLMDDVAPEKLKKLALDYVEETVHLRVTQECHPRRYRQRDGTSKWGLGFKSLLDAMWMQMMWLMDARDEHVRRCP
jgi:hypothetical protein